MTEGDVLLALLLIAGFALLGALITLGNVRQTRAIREVGEVLHEWAIRHIQLSRATAASAIRIEDPVAWFREMLARLELPAPVAREGGQIREATLLRQGEGWLLFRDAAGRLIFLHRPGVDPRPLERGSRFASPALPPGFLRRSRAMELSPVTTWGTFDLELAAAWKRLFPEEPPPERLWMRVGQPNGAGGKG
ncbi:MAG: hypothetical protein RMM10_12690 [Anaerolineae bacterium]|uniref:hypothetical protein n=1 Tax=Thermoflexus sp. TaxID=1969742 RepID=UPI0025DAC858|nr:hypothetical protein [Thermoflexus sp.]MCS7352351.1 hypothetical protein [Thermoflexus sp.]MDW8181814.1 hypothetical protein [Anaerolineae bacterium]